MTPGLHAVLEALQGCGDGIEAAPDGADDGDTMGIHRVGLVVEGLGFDVVGVAAYHLWQRTRHDLHTRRHE